jgi:hypothetical protein
MEDVILHYIHAKTSPIILESGPEGQQIKLPRCSSQVIISVWYDSTARLLADGVPREQTFPAGAFSVWQCYSNLRDKSAIKTLSDWQALSSLEPWRYNPVVEGRLSQAQTPLSFGEEIFAQSAGGQSSVTHALEGCDTSNLGLDPPEKHSSREDNEEMPYLWPSDAARYAAFSDLYPFRPRSLPSLDDKTAAEGVVDQPFVVDYRLPGRQLMGQHNVPTLEVLQHILRETHRETFIQDPDHAPDQPSASDFWTQVWFKLDTKPWAITSGQKLEGRFGWVLEYILEGRMPREALCIKDAMIQFFRRFGRSGIFATHPYYDYRKNDGCVSKFFAPDLSNSWLQAIMQTQGFAGLILSRLKQDYGVCITRTQLKYNYGILIAPAWDAVFWSNNGGPLYDQNPQPVTKEFEQAPNVKDVIRCSYLAGNAGTWAWLHVQGVQCLSALGNHHLLGEVEAIDPDFRQQSRIIRLELRKELEISGYVEDCDFGWHGRAIPPGAFDSGKLVLPRLEGFEPTSFGRNESLENAENVFIFFGEKEIVFRVEDDEILHRMPQSSLSKKQRQFCDLELEILRRRHKPSLKRGAELADHKSDDTQPTSKRMKWTIDKEEWVVAKIGRQVERPIDYVDLAKELNDNFGTQCSPIAVVQHARGILGLKNPNARSQYHHFSDE